MVNAAGLPDKPDGGLGLKFPKLPIINRLACAAEPSAERAQPTH